MAFQAVGKALFRAHVEGQLKVNKFGENYISVDYLVHKYLLSGGIYTE